MAAEPAAAAAAAPGSSTAARSQRRARTSNAAKSGAGGGEMGRGPGPRALLVAPAGRAGNRLAGLNQGLNLVRPGDLAGLKSSGPGAAAAARGAKNEAAAAATGQRRPCAEGGRREREEEEEGVRRQRRKRLPGGRLGLPTAGAACTAPPRADLMGPGPAAAWHRHAPGVAICRGCCPPAVRKAEVEAATRRAGLAPLRPASPACSWLK